MKLIPGVFAAALALFSIIGAQQSFANVSLGNTHSFEHISANGGPLIFKVMFKLGENPLVCRDAILESRSVLQLEHRTQYGYSAELASREPRDGYVVYVRVDNTLGGHAIKNALCVESVEEMGPVWNEVEGGKLAAVVTPWDRGAEFSLDCIRSIKSTIALGRGVNLLDAERAIRDFPNPDYDGALFVLTDSEIEKLRRFEHCVASVNLK